MLPIVEGVLDSGCLISSLSSIAIHPGESPQPIHAADQLLQLPKPQVATVVGDPAQAHLVRGEYEAAQHWAEQGLGVALAVGNFGAARSAAAIGLIVCWQVGDPGPTARYLDLLERGATSNLEPLSSAVVIEALLAAEAVEQAERYAETAYASAGGHLREAVAALALGDVRLRSSAARLPEAHEWYDRALRLAAALGLRSIAAGAMLGLGELAVARGDMVTAIRLFGEASAVHRSLGLGHYAARGERLLTACQADAHRSA